ncbi:MAG TPA: glycosyltransferase family 39 protein [Nevskiaceae bacterium]|nr:glycosyltransferase family 39 protein [Nevskiaceae bacterium]
MTSSSRILVAWLAVALVWFGTLGVRPLAHPDEGRYSEISREMLVTGDWITPRLDGLKYFEKPPLQYWATAAAFAAFGQSDFVARLWTALCGFISVLAVWYTARRLWGRTAAHYAALAAAGMAYLIAISHVVTLDSAVSGFLTLALCGFLRAQHDGASAAENRRWMLVAWASMAAAMLSKGLIGVVLPGAVLLLYSALCRDWRPWARMQWLRGLALFALIAAPWHVLVAMRNPEWAHFYFVHEHFERYTTTEHHREGAWWYFIPLLLAGTLPWTSLLPRALLQGWRDDAGTFRPRRFLVIWAAFIFFFFSISGSKLPGYILPVFPALALLLGPLLAALPSAALRRHLATPIVFGILLLVAAPFFAHSGSERTPMELNRAATYWLVPAALLMLGCCIGALRATLHNRTLSATGWLAAGSLLLWSGVMFGYNAYSPTMSSAALAQSLQGRLPASAPAYTLRLYDQTLPYYLRRTVTPVEWVDELELGEQQEPQRWIAQLPEFVQRWRDLSAGLAVMPPDTYTQLQQEGVPMTLVERNARRVVVLR